MTSMEQSFQLRNQPLTVLRAAVCGLLADSHNEKYHRRRKRFFTNQPSAGSQIKLPKTEDLIMCCLSGLSHTSVAVSMEQ